LADQMVAYWSSFARTGVPAPTGLPVWPAYDGAALSTKVMRFQPSDIGPITPFNADAEHQCTGFWWAAGR
jgi:para-nitrobenzyl esterase